MSVRTRAPRARPVEALEGRRLLADTLSAAIDGSKTHQTIDAIGAAITSGYQPGEYRSAAYYNQVFGDLGITAVRSGLDAGFETTNDNNDPNVFDWAKFDDTAIATTMEFFAQAKARGVTNFLLTFWTPPAYTKTNKAATNGGQLRPDMREEYAEYVTAAVLRAKARWGVDITQVSLANEPFFTEPYVSAMWTPAQLRETVKAVARRFKKEGLTTRIVAAEDVSSLYRSKKYAEAIAADPEASAAVPIVGTHYLTDADAQSLSATAATLGKKLWFTEVGNGNPDLAGAIGLARGIDSAFARAGASAWINWQLSNKNGFESLMNGTVPNEKYYALKHFAHFVRPGAKRVDVKYAGDDVRVSAYQQPATGGTADALTVELSNVRPTDVDVTIALSGLAAPARFRQYRTSAAEHCAEIETVAGGRSVVVHLPANSIVTLYAGPDLAPLTNATAAALVRPAPWADAWNTDPLRSAAFRGDFEGVKTLIAAGGDVNAAFGNGWTPLFTAAASPYNRSDLIVTALLNAGADAKRRDTEGLTALHVAAMNEIPAFGTQSTIAAARVGLLLAAGVDANAVDANGRTALHYAAMLPKLGGDFGAADTSVLQALLDAGANPAVKDKAGRTALDYAVAEGASGAAALLATPAPPPPLPAGTALLSGYVVDDKNEDGVWGRDEPGLAGRTVWIDLDNDGAIDPGEPTRTTAANGKYVFAGLPAGTYTLRQLLPAGWTQTRPAAAAAIVTTIKAGVARGGLDFCVTGRAVPPPPPPPAAGGTASLRAYVVNDTNKDGRWTGGELGVAGRTVWIDSDDDGVIDPGERTQTTAANGVFAFTGLAGGVYRVRQVLPPGWRQTYPASAGTVPGGVMPAALVVTLVDGQGKSGNSLGTAPA